MTDDIVPPSAALRPYVPATTSLSSSSAAALPLRTPGPGLAAARSRIGLPSTAAAASAPVAPSELPTRTPSMTAMKSAAPQISGFLPKTPAVDKTKRPRTKRRNEMVYHVSENGSPIAVAADDGCVPDTAAPPPFALMNSVSYGDVLPSACCRVLCRSSSSAARSQPAVSVSIGGPIQVALGDRAIALTEISQVS
jgi:hypothetical protein